MNRKKSVVFIITMLLLVLIVSGCVSMGKDKKNQLEINEKKIELSDLGIKKSTNNLSFKINKAKYFENKTIGDKKAVLRFSFEITNQNLEDVGVGAGDFKIVSEGETYEMYGNSNNFGEVIKVDSSMEGAGNYLIPSNLKKGKIVYHPSNLDLADKRKIEWAFTID